MSRTGIALGANVARRPLSSEAQRKERARARRDAAIFRIAMDNRKLALGCADCGWRGAPEALQFDHRPGEVKCFNISKATTLAWKRVLAELAKCDVVCANHHAIRTRGRT